MCQGHICLHTLLHKHQQSHQHSLHFSTISAKQLPSLIRCCSWITVVHQHHPANVLLHDTPKLLHSVTNSLPYRPSLARVFLFTCSAAQQAPGCLAHAPVVGLQMMLMGPCPTSACTNTPYSQPKTSPSAAPHRQPTVDPLRRGVVAETCLQKQAAPWMCNAHLRRAVQE